MSIEGQGNFVTIYFPVVFFCFTRPRYQVSVYWSSGLKIVTTFNTYTYILNEPGHEKTGFFPGQAQVTEDG